MFRGSLKSQVMKAVRWWKTKNNILSDAAPRSAMRVQNEVEKRF